MYEQAIEWTINARNQLQAVLDAEARGSSNPIALQVALEAAVGEVQKAQTNLAEVIKGGGVPPRR